MITFQVLHPKNSVLNHNCERGKFMYDVIITFKAKSLQHAFQLSQNDFSETYRTLGKRSTSVGDIIVDMNNKKHYFVSNVGFTSIPQTVAQYIDWGQVDD